VSSEVLPASRRSVTFFDTGEPGPAGSTFTRETPHTARLGNFQSRWLLVEHVSLKLTVNNQVTGGRGREATATVGNAGNTVKGTCHLIFQSTQQTYHGP
jgi:hypothetical protein